MVPTATTDTDTTDTITTPRHITLDLLRRRSEHNEGLVSTLEELALHQEELEAIGPILGRTCGRTLKILLLQNNVISTLDPRETKMLKSLEYLNLALNNLTTVTRGSLCRCEFLNKLDLTLNFVDVDELERTVDELATLRSLRELFLLGNPCMYSDVGDGAGSSSNSSSSSNDVVGKAAEALQASNADNGTSSEKKQPPGWKGCRAYVIARLPNLKSLDGTDVLRSERILATERLPDLVAELRQLALVKRAEKHEEEQHRLADLKKKMEEEEEEEDEVDLEIIGEEELTGHTPEVRSKISREMAEQKAAREEKERANMPRTKGEAEYEQEQREAIEKARQREEERGGNIKQCNEGRWKFSFDEESRPGYVLLTVPIQKFLSSTLVDVDVHPTYVSIVIKGRVLRLVLPAEVRSEDSTAQRSTTTGHLLLTMPKIDPNENMVSVRAASRYKEEMAASKQKKEKENAGVDYSKASSRVGPKDSNTSAGLASDMLKEATKQLKGSVRIAGLVDERHGGVKQEPNSGVVDMKAVSSTRKAKPQDGSTDTDNDDDSDEPPAMF